MIDVPLYLGRGGARAAGLGALPLPIRQMNGFTTHSRHGLDCFSRRVASKYALRECGRKASTPSHAWELAQN